MKSLINKVFKNNHHSGHISLFHRDSLKALFERNGFRIISFPTSLTLSTLLRGDPWSWDF